MNKSKNTRGEAVTALNFRDYSLYIEVISLAKAKKQTQKHSDISYDIIGLLLILGSIFVYISLLSNDPGYVGILIKKIIFGIFGIGAYVFPILVIILGIAIVYMKSTIKLNLKFYSFCLFFISILIALFVHTFKFTEIFYSSENNWLDTIIQSFNIGNDANYRTGGGAIGAFIGYGLLKLFGFGGTLVILSGLLITSILLFTEATFKNILECIRNIFKNIIDRLKKTLNKPSAKNKEIPLVVNNKLFKNDELNDKKEKIKEMDKKIKILDFTKDFSKNFQSKKEEDKKIDEPKSQINRNDDNIPMENKSDNKLSKNNIKKDIKAEEENIVNLINNSSIQFANYKIPSTKLLNISTDSKSNSTKKEVMNKVKILEDTLKNFGVSATISQVSVGPAITRYELQLSPGVKVSKITNLSDDISLSLASSGIRIEAPIPGKAAVGIEVPNKNITAVYLREVIESKEYMDSKSKISFAIGKDVAGATIVSDLAKMPHLLIAGATGSGKSVCINTLIASILYKSTPEEVKLLMIDPKVVELSIYKNIPHLLIPVVTDPKKAAGALNWAVQEMTDRYKKFADNNVRDITGYNGIEKDELEKLPQIVVIIDELADLMMVSPGDVEDSICRLAQMARAAGIHLVVATQRPSVDVITGLIKANIPSRISFAVSSQVDSRTILDMGGAEKLLGKGDMLFYPVGAAKPIRVQGAFVSEKEIEKLVTFIKEQVPPLYNNDIIKELDQVTVKSTENNAESSDELLPKAIEMIVESGQASILMLQRRLKIGYNRAARLIDEMEERKIIGGYEGSKPRKVLVSKEQMEDTQ